MNRLYTTNRIAAFGRPPVRRDDRERITALQTQVAQLTQQVQVLHERLLAFEEEVLAAQANRRPITW
jgi:hypothetical protein